MKNDETIPRILLILGGCFALLCVVMCFAPIWIPLVEKWRDTLYFRSHRETYEELAHLAEQSYCLEGACRELLPESARVNLETNTWFRCYGGKLYYVSMLTPSDNYYVYSPYPEFPDIPTCGYGFTGLDQLDEHWYFASKISYD